MAAVVRGRTTIRRSIGGDLPSGNLMMPRRPRGRLIEPWTFETQPGTTMAKLESAYVDSLSDIDATEDFKTQAKASGRYTDQGALTATLEFATTKIAPRAHRRRQVVAAAKKELADRAKLTLPVDKDPYAFALRQKKLEYVLRLPEKEREQMFFRETLDPDVERAAIELNLPAEVLGIPASALNMIKDRVLRSVHGAEIDALAQLEQAIAVAEPVVDAVPAEIAHECNIFDLSKFEALAAEHVKRATAPWLRRVRINGEDTIQTMVFTDRWRSRPATEEEIATGVYYKDGAEYQRAQTGDFTQTEKANGHAA